MLAVIFGFFFVFFLSCSEHEYNNPYDPNSPSYDSSLTSYSSAMSVISSSSATVSSSSDDVSSSSSSDVVSSSSSGEVVSSSSSGDVVSSSSSSDVVSSSSSSGGVSSSSSSDVVSSSSSSNVVSSSSSSVSISSSSSQQSSSSAVVLCNGTPLASNQFCYNNNELRYKCGEQTYTTEQFCADNKVYPKCNGQEYPTTYFCLSGESIPKCGDISTYEPWQYCLNKSLVYPKCGNKTYGDSLQNRQTEECCGIHKYTKATEGCCGSSVYDPNTQACCGGTVLFDSETQFCYPYDYDITVLNKCEGGSYDHFTQYCLNGELENYDFVPYQGKNYKTVVINGKTWLAENLNYSVKGSVCYGNQSSNCEKYGRLYNWSTAMNFPTKCNTMSSYDCTINTPYHRGICPENWHLPSWDEWVALADFINEEKDCDSYHCDAIHLNAVSGWDCSPWCNYSDSYGFSALPGGFGRSVSSFDGAGSSGVIWSATSADDSKAYSRTISNYSYNPSEYNKSDKSSLYSVRCVKDDI